MGGWVGGSWGLGVERVGEWMDGLVYGKLSEWVDG